MVLTLGSLLDYTSPIPSAQLAFWDYHVSLTTTFHGPWLLMGDFNEITLPREVRGGVFNQSRADALLRAMDTCNLIDLPTTCCKFI